MTTHRRNRRRFLAATAAAAISSASFVRAAEDSKFKPRYMLASCMYGYLPLAEIVPEVKRTGAASIDIWPKVHGNQREQLAEIGEAAFSELLAEHGITLGCITQYKLGPFGLREEMQLAKRLGCGTVVTGGKGPVGLTGAELKSAVGKFCEAMKPHLAAAEEAGVTIAIENHGNNLIDSPDSLKWLTELRRRPGVVLCLAARQRLHEEASQGRGTAANARARTARFQTAAGGIG